MNKVFHIDVYTPTGKYLSKDADFLKVTSSLSVLGIMPDHAPLITTLEICKMTIRNGGKEDNYAITGGVMHIKKDHNVVLMLDAIESVEEIDLDRAEALFQKITERTDWHSPNDRYEHFAFLKVDFSTDPPTIIPTSSELNIETFFDKLIATHNNRNLFNQL